MANCVWIRCGIPCAAIRASKKSSPPSHQGNDAEAPRRLSPAILNLACLQSGRLHKREAIAIADHVLAFEPTDPYAPRGKSERLLGNGRSQSSCAALCKTRFRSATTLAFSNWRQKHPALQPRQGSIQTGIVEFSECAGIHSLRRGCSASRRADMKYPG